MAVGNSKFLAIIQFGDEAFSIGIGDTADQANDRAIQAYIEEYNQSPSQDPEIKELKEGNRILLTGE